MTNNPDIINDLLNKYDRGILTEEDIPHWNLFLEILEEEVTKEINKEIIEKLKGFLESAPKKIP